GSGTYSTEIQVEDDAFLTICAIKPIVEFELFSDYTIEDDPPPAATPDLVNIKLNYQPDPSTSFTAGFFFNDITAVEGTDYNDISIGEVTFDGGDTERNFPIQIVNDLVIGTSPIKEFQIILDPATSSPNLSIGAKDTLVYSIYDNDPEPKITFTSSSSSVSETAGTAEITVQVLGTTTGSSTVRIIRPNTSVSGTATYENDYTLPGADGWANESGTRRKSVTIPAGTNQSVTVEIPIVADDIDENDETIIFDLAPQSGEAGTGDGSVLQHTITIDDQNPEPTARFISSASEGYRSISDPRIYVEISSASEKEIAIPFSIVGGTAINDNVGSGGDYSAAPEGGTVIFPPGVTEQFLYYNSSTGNANLIVYSNELVEEDRTILFELDDNPVNAGLGSIDAHTYTIKAYTEFEWQGVAGIGKRNDNTFWIVPDEASTGASGNIPNLS
ncbi:MAG: hypothetical protein LC664_13600, partial [Flavobacteriales bacterium]|nr:hypothetical protein [Flavobacteriales bacterium]